MSFLILVFLIASCKAGSYDWRNPSRMLDNQHRQTGYSIGPTYTNAVKTAAKSRNAWPWHYNKYDKQIKEQRNTIDQSTRSLRKEAGEVSNFISRSKSPISQERIDAQKRAMNAYHDADKWRRETLSKGVRPRRTHGERAAMLIKHADYVDHETKKRWS